MVVEVKCPYNKRNEDPNVVIPDFCFYDDFGKTQLKKSHPYFYQIQCQMYVLGYKSGKFLVQTPHGLLVVDLEFEEEFFNEKLKIVKQNYFGHYLVEMFEKRRPRRLEPFKITTNF